MSSRTLRRRLHHGDVDGKSREHFETSGMDSLSEPLLGEHEYSENNATVSTLEDIWHDKKKEQLHWAFLFSQLIAQWAQWLANIVLGSGSLIGRLLSLPSTALNIQNNRILPPPLSPLQEQRLRNLRQRLEVPFDSSKTEHQDALKQLWKLAYPDRILPGLISELWKEMGWQGADPATDFRGGGFISLENLIFFAQKYPESFHRLLHKEDGTRAEYHEFSREEIEWCNGGGSVSHSADGKGGSQAIPSSLSGIRFLHLLEEDEMAFDNLYCIAFQMMDAQWLAKRASYMEFNDVLKSTRTQLDRELALEDISSVKDLPAYNLLR